MRPLNGEKTHPLSNHAREELRNINERPLPRSVTNPGVANRLLRENLVELVELPSPFNVHKGRLIWHLRITDEGKKVLGQ